MDITSLSVADLKEILKLVELKQKLEGELEKVTQALSGIQAPEAAVLDRKPKASVSKVEKTEAPKPVKVKSSPAKPLKERIVSVLQAAGSDGVAVSDIATTLGLAPANLHVWFGTTGKKDASIQKVGRGRYAWKASAEVAPEQASTVSEPIAAAEPLPPVEQEASAPVAAEPVFMEAEIPQPTEALAGPEPIVEEPEVLAVAENFTVDVIVEPEIEVLPHVEEQIEGLPEQQADELALFASAQPEQ